MRFRTYRREAPNLVRTTVVGNYPRVGDTFEEQSLRRAVAPFDKGGIGAADLRGAGGGGGEGGLKEAKGAGGEGGTDGPVSWVGSQRHHAPRLSSRGDNRPPR